MAPWPRVLGFDMTPEVALQLFSEGFVLTVVLVSAIVGPSLLVGLVVATFQAATQINEQTLSFLPRLLVTLATIMILGPWLVQEFTDLFTSLLFKVPEVIG